jgi:hypothetical protein
MVAGRVRGSAAAAASGDSALPSIGAFGLGRIDDPAEPQAATG